MSEISVSQIAAKMTWCNMTLIVTCIAQEMNILYLHTTPLPHIITIRIYYKQNKPEWF
jgi:hypothetical protein